MDGRSAHRAPACRSMHSATENHPADGPAQAASTRSIEDRLANGQVALMYRLAPLLLLLLLLRLALPLRLCARLFWRGGMAGHFSTLATSLIVGLLARQVRRNPRRQAEPLRRRLLGAAGAEARALQQPHEGPGRLEPAAPPTPPAAASLQRGRVLVVDDNAVNALLAQAMLDRLGLQSETAADGLQALQALQRERFDAVLMDCCMPHLDGWEATRQWRRQEQARRVPIIGVTANVSPQDQQRCFDAGMDAFLGKPFRFADLAALLQEHLAST